MKLFLKYFFTFIQRQNRKNALQIEEKSTPSYTDEKRNSEEESSLEIEREVVNISQIAHKNQTIMQYFEWYLMPDCSLWKSISLQIEHLSKLGITALWLPPAYKGANGKDDVGYGPYDLYDLGEFNQKGSISTKYGTKDEYLEAINEAHKYGIEIYADIVLSHKGGADETEKVKAIRVDKSDRNKTIGTPLLIDAWTRFNFKNRENKYSNFKWNSSHFNAVDFDNKTKENSIFKFYGNNNNWSEDVDNENGNFEYLIYADINMSKEEVVKELKKWGSWYVETTKVDGFRLDAVKHIKFSFYKEWLSYLRNKYKKDFFAVGEYWSGDLNKLIYYLNATENCMHLFDVPLHFKFYDASQNKDFNFSRLLDDTLSQYNPQRAVTFVDNHDTEPYQSLESWIKPWFKPLAYTFILTRKEGIPCIFYGDYYGNSFYDICAMRKILDLILKVRKDYAYGEQHDYFDDGSVIGWTREGHNKVKASGLAAVISKENNVSKWMYVGKHHANTSFYDCTGSTFEKVVINKAGYGNFKVIKNFYSIWLPCFKKEDTINEVCIFFSLKLPSNYIVIPNTEFYLIGNLPELGKWNNYNAIKLELLDEKLEAKINVPKNAIIEFKLFIKDNGNINWESGANRLTFSGEEDFQYSGMFRI